MADTARVTGTESRWRIALRDVEASIEAAWTDVRGHGDRGDSESELALSVVEHPDRHPWRVVDAALDRLLCPACGSRLGSGARGCASCDFADGFRFAAREPDRHGVGAGNEHAIRVCTAVLRAPGRYPAWSVAANRLFLPLFLGGQMPTRRQQEDLLAASQRGLPAISELERAGSFGELAAIAKGEG